MSGVCSWLDCPNSGVTANLNGLSGSSTNHHSLFWASPTLTQFTISKWHFEQAIPSSCHIASVVLVAERIISKDETNNIWPNNQFSSLWWSLSLACNWPSDIAPLDNGMPHCIECRLPVNQSKWWFSFWVDYWLYRQLFCAQISSLFYLSCRCLFDTSFAITNGQLDCSRLPCAAFSILLITIFRLVVLFLYCTAFVQLQPKHEFELIGQQCAKPMSASLVYVFLD